MRVKMSCFVTVLLLSAIAVAGRAAADAGGAGSFSCRASALRVSVAKTAASEPAVANSPGDPCADDAPASKSISIPSIAKVTALAARTDADPGEVAGSKADASLASAAVTLGTLRIETGVLESRAEAACTREGASPSLTGSSSVAQLRINGGPPRSLEGPTTITIGLVTIHLNRSVVTGDSVIRRAVEIVGPLTRVVLAEAVAGVESCELTAPPDSPPTAVLEIFTPPIDLSNDPPDESCSPSEDADDPYLGCSYDADRMVWTQREAPGRILWGICPGTNHPHCAAYPFDEIPWTFDFRGIGSTDADGDLTTWTIDFGDGTSVSGTWAAAPPIDLEHTYFTRDFDAGGGSLTLTLTVTDAAGHADTDALTIGLVLTNDI